MVCRLDRAAAAALWPALRQCADRLRSADSDRVLLHFRNGKDDWQCVDAAGQGTVTVEVTVEATVDAPPALDAGAFPPAAAPWIQLYLPLITGAWRARRRGTTFVTAHVAQTLDGRIACTNGHSQWISNEANLLHAHRLRALHDAVLVGSGTVAADDPQLTTRLVPGDDPRRIVLSGNGNLAQVPAPKHLFEAPGATILCRSDRIDRFDAPHHEVLDFIPLEPNGREDISPTAVCRQLAERGIHGIFLEGGSRTLSSFLDAGAIDVLHVHIAPLILGSGISSFTLDPVSHVRDGLKLELQHFDLEDEILLVCRGGAR